MRTILLTDRYNDWCHICGNRNRGNVEIWYPKNAEHETKNTEYLRICRTCVEAAFALFQLKEADHRAQLAPNAEAQNDQ